MLLAVLLALPVALSANGLRAGERTQDFHADPQWDGYRNRLVPDNPPRTRQDFGYQPADPAVEREVPSIGGRVQRSTTVASYAKAIEIKSLDEPLQARGRFRLTRAEGSSGVLFGWFHSTSKGWRTPNSLVVRLDGNGGKCWVFFEYGTRNWLTGGGHTFDGLHYQTTTSKPVPADGAAHDWSLEYDPEGHAGDGQITFTLDGLPYHATLAPGHKRDGATFDRFRILNVQTTGESLDVALDSLVLDGVPLDLARDSQWLGVGNRADFADRIRRPWHDFGFSPTHRAGGAPGELGGVIWRDEAPAYYGDCVERLSLDDELRASGTLTLDGAASDSGVYLGWFNASSKRQQLQPEHKAPQQNLLGILIEGPSRVGHYVRPVYRTARGSGQFSPAGPIVKPDGQVHRWSLRYAPHAAAGHGEIAVTFDGRTQTLPLDAAHRAEDAAFDRFGLVNLQSGGHYVSVYFDDLQYTASPTSR